MRSGALIGNRAKNAPREENAWVESTGQKTCQKAPATSGQKSIQERALMLRPIKEQTARARAPNSMMLRLTSTAQVAFTDTCRWRRLAGRSKRSFRRGGESTSIRKPIVLPTVSSVRHFHSLCDEYGTSARECGSPIRTACSRLRGHLTISASAQSSGAVPSSLDETAAATLFLERWQG